MSGFIAGTPCPGRGAVYMDDTLLIDRYSKLVYHILPRGEVGKMLESKVGGDSKACRLSKKLRAFYCKMPQRSKWRLRKKTFSRIGDVRTAANKKPLDHPRVINLKNEEFIKMT